MWARLKIPDIDADLEKQHGGAQFEVAFHVQTNVAAQQGGPQKVAMNRSRPGGATLPLNPAVHHHLFMGK